MKTRTQDLTDDIAGGVAVTAFGTWVLIVLAVVVLAVASLFTLTNGWFYGRENANIRHSIGYTTAANQRCAADMQQYADAAARGDQSHMAADYADCRLAVQGLAPSEVDRQVAQFLASHR